MLGNVMINQSPLNMAVQRVEFPGDMWLIRIEFAPTMKRDFLRVEAFWNRLRGKAHNLRIWHLGHPVPYGTISGSPALSTAAVQGANSISISAAGGSTLEPGDMLGVTLNNGRTKLVQVTEANGVGNITALITPPLPRAAVTGAAIIWNRPTVDCMVTSAVFMSHRQGYGDGFSIECVEIPY